MAVAKKNRNEMKACVSNTPKTKQRYHFYLKSESSTEWVSYELVCFELPVICQN